jgi:hypothetical protein
MVFCQSSFVDSIGKSEILEMVYAVRSFENINEETLKNGYRVMISVRWASIT